MLQTNSVGRKSRHAMVDRSALLSFGAAFTSSQAFGLKVLLGGNRRTRRHAERSSHDFVTQSEHESPAVGRRQKRQFLGCGGAAEWNTSNSSKSEMA
jgi:hypothetical protein